MAKMKWHFILCTQRSEWLSPSCWPVAPFNSIVPPLNTLQLRTLVSPVLKNTGLNSLSSLLMFTAWLQLVYRKILCNFCPLEFTRGPNGKCFNKEFALAFMRKCCKWLLLFKSTNSVDSQKYSDGSTNRFEDEKS